MEKKDLIAFIADAMDKHTKTIDEVQCIMYALKDISDFMSYLSGHNESNVQELGIVLRGVDKNVHTNPLFIDRLYESVFEDIQAMMLAKQHSNAFRIMCFIASDCTDNEELMSVTDVEPSQMTMKSTMKPEEKNALAQTEIPRQKQLNYLSTPLSPDGLFNLQLALFSFKEDIYTSRWVEEMFSLLTTYNGNEEAKSISAGMNKFVQDVIILFNQLNDVVIIDKVDEWNDYPDTPEHLEQ